jgi:malic enzyme
MELRGDFYFYIQGTASVVLSGLIAALKLVEGTLAEHTFLFLGAGEVNFCYLICYLNQIVNSDKIKILRNHCKFCY